MFFETILSKIFIGLFAILTSVAGAFGIDAQPQFGATIPIIVSDFQTALAVSITASSTSMTLIDGTDTAGNTLSGYMCFVIDSEYICGTTAGTAVSSLVRGIDPVDGDKHVYSLTKAHRRGASVKITNHPSLAIVSRILNGDETIPNVLSYSSQPTFNQDEQLATKKYADDLAIAGSPAGSTTIAGIFQVANTNQLIHYTTTTGSTGKLLILPLSYFATSTDKRGATTTVVMTDIDGKLDQSFYDLTETWTFTASTTLATTTITKDTTIQADLTVNGTTTADHLDITGSTQGDILYYDAVEYQNLATGKDGQLLEAGGTGANPNWVNASTTLFVGASNFSGARYSSTTGDSWATTTGSITTFAGDPDRLTDNDISTQVDFYGTSDYVEVEFDKPTYLRNWSQYGDSNNDGNGKWKIQYYNQRTAAWVDWHTNIPINAAVGWVTITASTTISTYKVRVVSTTIDTGGGGNYSRAMEWQFRYEEITD